MDEPRKRTVSLPPDLDKSIEDAVAAGEFSSAEQAIAEVVREWRERRENWGYTIAELRAEVQKGIDSGVAKPGEPLLEEMIERYRQLYRGAAAE